MNQVFVWLLGAGVLGLAAAVFAILVLANESGRRIGAWRARRTGMVEAGDAPTALVAGMLSLLAFILGLTLNFAENRFEARRELVVNEANAIGTAFLRSRLVDGDDGRALGELIRGYAAARLEFTRAARNGPIAPAEARSAALQQEIWDRTMRVARQAPTPITATLITALNQMFDDAAAQRFAFLGEAPGNILEVLILASVIAVGALGYEQGLRGSAHRALTWLLLALWTSGMAVTVDLTRPRLGAIQVDPSPLVWALADIDHARNSAAP
jgi:hypothetical protein